MWWRRFLPVGRCACLSTGVSAFTPRWIGRWAPCCSGCRSPYILAVRKDEAWIALGYLLLGVSLYFALINWTPLRQRPAILAWGWLALGVVLAVVGFGLLNAHAIGEGLLRELHNQLRPLLAWLGEEINPNVLSGTLVLAIPMMLALALGREARPGWLRVGLILSAMLMVGVIALAYSRGALSAVVLSTALVLALHWSRFWPWMAVMLLPVGGAILWVGPGRLLAAIAENEAVGGLDVRLAIFQLSIEALQRFHLYGIGIGMYPYVMPALFPGAEHATVTSQPHAHNLLLQIGLDLGVPGLAAYLVMIVTALTLLIRVWRRSPKLAHRTLAIGALGALTAMFVYGLVDAVTWGTKLAFVPWFLYALAAMLDRDLARRRMKR